MGCAKDRRNVRAILTVMNFMRDLGTGMAEIKADETRKTAMNTEVGDQVVDTCLAFDTHMWETGIQRNGDWTIVEKYDDEESARDGHARWSNALGSNPEMELTEVGLDDHRNRSRSRLRTITARSNLHQVRVQGLWGDAPKGATPDACCSGKRDLRGRGAVDDGQPASHRPKLDSRGHQGIRECGSYG